jgi:phenylpropionate dioxygenase-like ring-hydroxylating dioxygenase large terminal subunit
LLAGCGNAQRITCPYHAWTYRLDGQLVAAPYMHDSTETDDTPFATDHHQLVRVRSEVWQGFVFVTADENAAPLATQLGELDDVIGRYRLADYVPVHRAVEVWNTNWKHLVENFMDAYHVFKVHRDSFGAGGDSTLATTMHPGTDASAHHVVIDEPGGAFGVADAGNTHLEGTWRHTTVLAAVFPTHIMQVQPDWLWYLDIAPIGTGQVRIRWDVSIAPTTYAAQRDPEAYVRSVLRLLEQVNGEDRPVVEGVTGGMRRAGITSAPLSYLERNVFDFDRYIARRIGR